MPFSGTDLQELEYNIKCKLRATTEDGPVNIINNEKLTFYLLFQLQVTKISQAMLK